MKPRGMFIDEFAEERKGLFKELEAVHLGCWFCGYGNTHLWIRLDHGSPDADESHGLLKEILVMVAIRVKIGSELVGHSLHASDTKEIYIDGNDVMSMYRVLNTLYQP
jgi:hypothetical protein